MIDSNTKNKSFKEMRNILYDMGILNSDFMLKLHDANLIDIPENPKDWDQDLRKRIVRECKTNFWFFVREIIRIPSNTNICYGDDYTYCNRFPLRMDTLRLFFAYINNINVYYLTMGEDSIFEAIAVLMIYEYFIRDDKRVNYDNELPDEVSNIISNIIELNKHVLFLPIIGENKICRTSKESFGLNKFIFNFLNGEVDTHYCMPAISTLICLDGLYALGLSDDATIMRDKLLPFIKNSFKEYENSSTLFNSTEFDSKKSVYVKPSYLPDMDIL